MVTRPSPMESIKKIAKFFWRHIFTFYILSVIVRAAIAGNVVILSALLYLVGAVIVDWAKQFIKPGPNSNMPLSSHHGPVDFNRFNNSDWSNPRIIGSDTYLMNQSRDIYN